MLNLLIFDLDGTLIDSKKDIADALNYALDKEGFPTLTDKKIEELVGRGAKQLVQEALGDPSEADLNRVFSTFFNYYEAHLLVHTHLYPGVFDFLEKYSQIPMAVVTNKPESFSKIVLEGLKIDHYFRWLIGGDSLPVRKPDPKVFDPILSKISQAHQILMIGDSEIDIESGRAAGFLTCGVSYGFRPRQALENARPDFLIDRFDQLDELMMMNFSETQSMRKEA